MKSRQRTGMMVVVVAAMTIEMVIMPKNRSKSMKMHFSLLMFLFQCDFKYAKIRYCHTMNMIWDYVTDIINLVFCMHYIGLKLQLRYIGTSITIYTGIMAGVYVVSLLAISPTFEIKRNPRKFYQHISTLYWCKSIQILAEIGLVLMFVLNVFSICNTNFIVAYNR